MAQMSRDQAVTMGNADVVIVPTNQLVHSDDVAKSIVVTGQISYFSQRNG